MQRKVDLARTLNVLRPAREDGGEQRVDLLLRLGVELERLDDGDLVVCNVDSLEEYGS